MENRKTFFDYAAQVLMIFGLTVAAISLCSFAAGDKGKELSTFFALGSQGLSHATLAQIMGLSVLITLARFLFFSDRVIKNLSVRARTAGMLISCVAAIVAFVLIFDWFPGSDVWAWVCFAASFVLCFTVSYLLTKKREQVENDKMAEALERLKSEDN